jgi:RTX calcium-binding nonapeptide repeat (4 copies)
VRSLGSALVLLLALPGAAGAATVSVEPYVEPPDVDPFSSCGRYMMCPPDMVVVAAAPGESNIVAITEERFAYPRNRYLVRDQGAPPQAGAGCEQVDDLTVACTAGTIGPARLGDGDDRMIASGGEVHGGPGVDVLMSHFGEANGDEGDDVLIGQSGTGGAGDDFLVVRNGNGDSGDDVLRCSPQVLGCGLDGGSGDDQLTGGAAFDALVGRSGDDVLRSLGERDRLRGGRGADRLVGGKGRDEVDCGAGRRDEALADRRDRVTRCERVTPA